MEEKTPENIKYVHALCPRVYDKQHHGGRALPVTRNSCMVTVDRYSIDKGKEAKIKRS